MSPALLLTVSLPACVAGVVAAGLVLAVGSALGRLSIERGETWT